MPFLKRSPFAAHGIRLAALACLAWPTVPGATWTPIPDTRPTPERWFSNSTTLSTRLAVDRNGTVFASLSDTLFIVSPAGGLRKIPPLPAQPFPGGMLPVAVDSGTVLWGNKRSLDGGSTWNVADTALGFFSPNAVVIFPDGRALMGGAFDDLWLSLDSGITWKRSYTKETFGAITNIAVMPGGWALAASSIDTLLASVDGGATWKTVRGDGLVRNALLAADPDPGGASAWVLNLGSRKPPAIRILRRDGDSVKSSLRAPSLNFPDSAATDWAVSALPNQGRRLWLSTWGQGVFTSDDSGTTWEARNGGLQELYVCAIEISPVGKAWVLARDGLYSDLTGPSSVRRVRAGDKRSARIDSPNGTPLYRMGLRESGLPGVFFRVDGHRVPLIPPKEPDLHF